MRILTVLVALVALQGPGRESFRNPINPTPV